MEVVDNGLHTEGDVEVGEGGECEGVEVMWVHIGSNGVVSERVEATQTGGVGGSV